MHIIVCLCLHPTGSCRCVYSSITTHVSEVLHSDFTMATSLVTEIFQLHFTLMGPPSHISGLWECRYAAHTYTDYIYIFPSDSDIVGPQITSGAAGRDYPASQKLKLPIWAEDEWVMTLISNVLAQKLLRFAVPGPRALSPLFQQTKHIFSHWVIQTSDPNAALILLDRQGTQPGHTS